MRLLSSISVHFDGCQRLFLLYVELPRQPQTVDDVAELAEAFHCIAVAAAVRYEKHQRSKRSQLILSAADKSSYRVQVHPPHVFLLIFIFQKLLRTVESILCMNLMS